MIDGLTYLDVTLRAAASALMMQAALLFWRSSLTRTSILGSAFLLAATVSCWLEAISGFPLPVVAIASCAAALTTPLFWLFALSWFDDSYRFGRLSEAVLVVFGGSGLIMGLLVGTPAYRVLDVGISLFGTLLALHACWLVWADRDDDLVEPRRQMRARFVVAVSALILCSLWSGFSAPWVASAFIIDMLNDALLAGVALLLTTALFGLRHADLFPSAKPTGNPEEASTAKDQPEGLPPGVTERLEQEMAVERLYREPGLTIGALASKLDLPEHRLRRYINGTLGHRNFSEYLNRHRIAEVCTALADPEQREVPILTIALDAGFGSLPAFNRAFRAERDQTPSEYRRARLSMS